MEETQLTSLVSIMRHSNFQVHFLAGFLEQDSISMPDRGTATHAPLGFITARLRKPSYREMKSPVLPALGQPAERTMETWNTSRLSTLMTEPAIKNNNSNSDNKLGSSTTSNAFGGS